MITPPRAGLREWIGLAVLMLPTLLIAMDITVLHLAVPALSVQLQPTSSELLWITDIYGFMIAGSLITMGTLGDRIGRKRLLLAGALAFGFASVIAAFSTTPTMLIASRALLGVAGATLMPSTMSLIRNMFLDSNQRTTAIGVWVSGFSVGSAVGPLIGGALLEYFWWGSVFLIGVPVMAVLLIAGSKLLPEYRDPNPGRFDLLSAGMSLISVLLVIYGLKQIAESGFSGIAILTVAAGLIIAALFIDRQRRLADPLIDLRLFSIPAFSASLATYTLGIFFNFGLFLFIAQYMQLVVGLSPLQAGIWSIPGAVTFIIGSNLAPRLVRHIRPVYIVAGGLIVAAFAMGLITQVGVDSLPLVAIANSIMALGFGFTFTLTVDLVVASAPPERAGAASATAETGAELGGALGLALLGSFGLALYRNQVTAALPDGLAPEMIHTIRETLSGALEAATHLPEQAGTALVLNARESFVHALQVNALIGTIGFIGLAILVATMLREIPLEVGHEESDSVRLPEAQGTTPF